MKRKIIAMALLMGLLSVSAFGALTKTETNEAMVWTSITNTGDASGIIETGTQDISGSYSTTIHIDVCLSEDATAHDGTEVIVQIASEADVDDAWTTLVRYTCLAGLTADMDDVAATEPPGETAILLTSVVADNFDEDGKFIFFLDAGDVTASEIAYQIDNTPEVINLLDGLTAQKDAADTVFTVAGFGSSAVHMKAIALPLSSSEFRVIINNWFDQTGSNVHGRVRYTMVTAL